MVLIRYFYKRFFLNFIFVSFLLTFLFNLIEFFEKVVRVKQAPISVIASFIALNIIPSFFENLPISSWLATCMMLKEIHQQREWETIQLLNIRLTKIFNLFLIATTFVAIFSFFGKELGTKKLAAAAEYVKQEQLKQTSPKKVFNQWFTLQNNLFCHINYMDYETNEGQEITLLEVSPQFTIEKITSCQNFIINQDTKELIIPEGLELLTQAQTQQVIHDKHFVLPTLFDQLNLHTATTPLLQIFHLVIFGAQTLPSHVYNQILYGFLQRLLSHLLIIFYPLLTFCLFFLFPHHNIYRWILIVIPYPFITLLFAATDYIMQAVQNGLVAFIPYVILLLSTIGLFFAIRK